MDFRELKLENRKRIAEYSKTPGGKADFYPAYMQIEQTSRCNAECIMCNHFYLGNRGCSDISEAVLEKIAPVLPYCETVMLNGDGEPFLSPTIESSISMYHRYGVMIGTNTNLSVIPDFVLPHLRQTFGFINISCDGATKETYEMIRRGLDFDKFLQNLRLIDREAPDLLKCFDCVVMKQNIHELPDIVRMAHDYGIYKVKFQRLGVNPIIGNESDRAEYYYDLLKEQLEKAAEEGKRLGIQVVTPGYNRSDVPGVKSSLPDKELLYGEINDRRTAATQMIGGGTLADDYYSEKVTAADLEQGLWNAGKACQWAIERCYIDLKGNVTTCCFNMKKNFGSLLENSFEEIWNGREYTEFRKLMSGKMLPDFCRQCNWIRESVF